MLLCTGKGLGGALAGLPLLCISYVEGHLPCFLHLERFLTLSAPAKLGRGRNKSETPTLLFPKVVVYLAQEEGLFPAILALLYQSFAES